MGELIKSREDRRHGFRLFLADRQPLSRTTSAARMNAFAMSSTRRSMPRSSASIPPGSASIISTRSACSPAPIWRSPTSRRKPRNPPRAGGDRAADPSSDPRRRAMGDARSAQRRPRRFRHRPRLRPQRIHALPGAVRRQRPRPSPKGSRSSRALVGPGTVSRITANIIRSRMSRSRRSRCSGRSRCMSRRSRGRRRARGEARLRSRHRAVRRGDHARRLAKSRRYVSRCVRQARQQARAA